MTMTMKIRTLSQAKIERDLDKIKIKEKRKIKKEVKKMQRVTSKSASNNEIKLIHS